MTSAMATRSLTRPLVTERALTAAPVPPPTDEGDLDGIGGGGVDVGRSDAGGAEAPATWPVLARKRRQEVVGFDFSHGRVSVYWGQLIA